MADNGVDEIERIQSEIDDQETVPESYEILTYPADYTLEILVGKFNKSIIAPGFQRKFVWTIIQASRLIESFILGLPVPPIFLYNELRLNKYLVVDGYQRLRSIAYYFEGYFGESDHKGNRTVFALQGLNEKSSLAGKTYQQLAERDETAWRRLNEAVLRSFIIKQLEPKGTSSIYHIFERLNTGGTQLVGQEIRNCVFHGAFNNRLISMNRTKEWREILGRPDEDKRMRDVELILRFLALRYSGATYKKPMKKFLSDFMDEHKNEAEGQLKAYEELFKETTNAVLGSLKAKPFHIRAGVNVAAFDSVYVAFARNLNRIPENIEQRYKDLTADPEFLGLIAAGTTDEEVVKDRFKLAEKILFG